MIPLRKWGNVIDPQVKEKIDQERSEIAKSGQLRKVIGRRLSERLYARRR